MITSVDYLVIGFYLAFMLLIGLVFRRFSRDISDYFRGGGTMLWWMTGASALMTQMSAWSFTGAAGAIYEMGTLIVCIYASNALSLVFVYFFSCRRFRQMRVVTYGEAVRRRFGGATEQFYVWLLVPVSLVGAGISLNAVSVFISSVFHLDVITTTLAVGTVVVLVAMLAGAWSVVAGDCLQLVLMLTVMGLAIFFTLRLPEIGGLSGLLNKVPATHFHWAKIMRPGIVGLWVLAIFINQFCTFNNMAEGAARFLNVKDGVHAQRACLAMIICFLLIPLLLFIPPLASVVLFPNLAAQFPTMRNPQEAAFVAVCIKTMPSGIIGLLVAGIFAVAMASMDTGLNRNAGLFTRNFYQRFIRKNASDRELLWIAKVCTAVFGVIIVGIAIYVSEFRSLDLFHLVFAFSSLVAFPITVPMVLGVFIRRAPQWSGWSTAIVGIVVAWIVRFAVGPAVFARMLGWEGLSGRELEHLNFAATIFCVAAVTLLWFALSMKFAGSRVSAEVERFFADMNTPIDPVKERLVYDDRRQYQTMGILFVIYGCGLILLALLPNNVAGRVSFVVCGSVILLIGAALRYCGRRQSKAGAKVVV